MRIIAKEIKSEELQAGDLFSNVGQGYWDNYVYQDPFSVGQKVYIRTEAPCLPTDMGQTVFLINIEKGGDSGWR